MIKLPKLPTRKEDDSAGFSGYASSALDEGTEGYTPTQIEDQEEQKGIVPGAPQETEEYEEAPEQPQRQEIPSAPIYPEYPMAQPVERIRKGEVEALIEQVVEEKWNTITAGVGDINLWKEKVRTEIISIKQELLRLEHRFEEVNKAVLGKVSEYDKGIKTVGTDVKAIEKVLQKILTPLTTNIKELDRLTQRLKK